MPMARRSTRLSVLSSLSATSSCFSRLDAQSPPRQRITHIHRDLAMYYTFGSPGSQILTALTAATTDKGFVMKGFLSRHPQSSFSLSVIPEASNEDRRCHQAGGRASPIQSRHRCFWVSWRQSSDYDAHGHRFRHVELRLGPTLEPNHASFYVDQGGGS